MRQIEFASKGEFDAIRLPGRIHFSRPAKPVGHAFSIVIVAITLRVMSPRVHHAEVTGSRARHAERDGYDPGSIVVQDRAEAAVLGEQRVAAEPEQVEEERLVGLC